MLDFVYYPVSAVLRFWHDFFAAAFGPTSAAAWVPALAFLVVTLKAPLVYPFLSYMRHARRLHALKPHLDAIQQRYSRDRDRYAAEVEKLCRANRVNTLNSCAGCLTLGCLWGLVSMLVWVGLFHVLRCFDRTGTPSGLPIADPTAPMSAEQNMRTANYLFPPEDVQSYSSARIFGAPLHLAPISAGTAFVPVAMVAVVVTLLFAYISYLGGRDATVDDSTDHSRVHLVWVLVVRCGGPICAIVAGAFLPLGMMMYVTTAATWNYLQSVILRWAVRDYPESVCTPE